MLVFTITKNEISFQKWMGHKTEYNTIGKMGDKYNFNFYLMHCLRLLC